MKIQFGIVLSILSSLLSLKAQAELIYSRDYNFSYNGTLVSMDSLRFSQKIVTFKAVEKNFQTMTISLSPGGSKTCTYNLTSAQQIRPDDTNYVGGPNNYTSFTTSTATRYINNFTINIPFYTVGSANQTIIDCFYGPLVGSMGMLIKNIGTGFYHLFYFQDQILQTTVALPIHASMVFFRTEVSQGNCHILFQQAIAIYTLNPSLNFVKKINFPTGTNSIVSLSANSTYLLYSYGTIGYVCSTAGNSYSVVDSVDVNDQIIDLRVAYPYILISTLTTFVQYDMDARVSISTLAHVLNITGLRMAILSNMFAIFYKPYYNQHFYTYKYDNKSSCVGGCTVCPNSYSLDTVNLWCIKNYSAYIPPSPPPNNTNTTNSSVNSSGLNSSTFNSSILNNSLNTTNTNTNTNSTNSTNNNTNSTNSITNNSTTINNTNTNISTLNGSANNNTTNNTSITITNGTNSTNGSTNSTNFITDYGQEQQFVNDLLIIFSKGLTFSSFRLTPKIFMTFTFFVDDIEFYVYHRHNYSDSVKFFMTKANLINDIKISAWMLEATEVFNQNQVALDESRRYQQFMSSSPHNPEATYFLAASEPIYKNYLAVVILLYCGSKLLHLMVYSIRDKAALLGKTESCLKNKTKLLIFVIAFIEPNISQLSFNCFMQMKFFFRFNIFNTVNLIVCVITLYAIIFYTIVVYPLSYALGCKKLAKQLLVRSKFGMRSFISEGYYFCIRAIIKGFIHSFFIENYEIQMALLITVDLINILLLLANRKTFEKFSLFILFLGYNLTFLLLNISFEIGRIRPDLVQKSIYDTINFSIMLTLVSFALLATVYITLIEFNELRKKFVKWLFYNQPIIERGKQRKVLAYQSDFASEVPSPHSASRQTASQNAKNLAKISIRQVRRKEDNAAAKERWAKSIKQITNKSMITKQETNAELESVGALQRSMRTGSRKSKGLIKIKKAKMRKFIDESKENLRKLIRLESRKWTIEIAE